MVLAICTRYDTMHTPAAKSIMQKLEESLQKQEEALEELEKKQVP